MCVCVLYSTSYDFNPQKKGISLSWTETVWHSPTLNKDMNENVEFQGHHCLLLGRSLKGRGIEQILIGDDNKYVLYVSVCVCVWNVLLNNEILLKQMLYYFWEWKWEALVWVYILMAPIECNKSFKGNSMFKSVYYLLQQSSPLCTVYFLY